jgi:hypothetical protein
MCGRDLSDSCNNSHDGHVSGNVSDDDGGGGGYNGKDDDNEDYALWDENNHGFYVIKFRASFGYKPPRNGQMPVSTHDFIYHIFSATLFEEIAAGTIRYASRRTCRT